MGKKEDDQYLTMFLDKKALVNPGPSKKKTRQNKQIQRQHGFEPEESSQSWSSYRSSGTQINIPRGRKRPIVNYYGYKIPCTLLRRIITK